MKYSLLIYGAENDYASLSEEAGKEMYAGHFAFIDKNGPVITSSAELQSVTSATSVGQRADGQQVVTDGPFAETAEQLGGFYIVEAADLDAAVALAKQIPSLPGHSIEIRPLVEH